MCICVEMEWNREQMCLLIDLYRAYRMLWDSSDPDYKNRSRKHDAWAAIAATLGINKDEVESKMRKLIGQFKREDKKGKSYTGQSRKWFAYKLLLFLKDKTLPNHTSESGLNDHPQNLKAEESTEFQEDTRRTSDEESHIDTPEDRSTSNDFTPSTSSRIQSTKRLLNDNTLQSIKKKPTTYEMTDEAYNPMRNLQDQYTMPHKKDEFDAFGEYVAHTIRNLKTHRARVYLKHEINNLLFNAELGCPVGPTTVYPQQKSAVSYNSSTPSRISFNPSPIPPVNHKKPRTTQDCQKMCKLCVFLLISEILH